MQQGGIQLNLFGERDVTVDIARYNVWRRSQSPRPPILLNSDTPRTCGETHTFKNVGECIRVIWSDSKGEYVAWMPSRFVDPAPTLRDLLDVDAVVLGAKHRAKIVVKDEEEAAHARMLAAYLNNPLCIKVSA